MSNIPKDWTIQRADDDQILVVAPNGNPGGTIVSHRDNSLEKRLLHALADALLHSQPSTDTRENGALKVMMKRNGQWVEIEMLSELITSGSKTQQQLLGRFHTHQWIMRDGKEVCLRCDAVKGGA